MPFNPSAHSVQLGQVVPMLWMRIRSALPASSSDFLQVGEFGCRVVGGSAEDTAPTAYCGISEGVEQRETPPSSGESVVRVAFYEAKVCDMDLKQPWFAVDCVVFDERERVLLIRRKNPPFQGQYALPGGFIDYGETVEHAAARELHEETNLISIELTLVGVYSDPDRDPRRHVVLISNISR